MKVKPAFCKLCQANVKAEADTVNHILHLILTLITFGVWVIVWLVLALKSGWSCVNCGGSKLSRPKIGLKVGKT